MDPSRKSDPATSASGPLEPGEIIMGRYRVIKLLGRGGMGAVYHAWDDELGVPVAIKILLAQYQDDPILHDENERRLKKELLLARQITHKNVVRIHDIGEVRGMKFISMSYIQGEDLATIVKRQPLAVPQALALARQIASGLAAAHEAGVIHRDLKPGNIMVERGESALLTDFGIARSVRAGSGPHTITGTVSGTIDYMAPEQASGEVVDGRADIYAFGLIVYEMLAGQRRLARDSALRDLVNRMTTPPVPVRTLQPDVPEAFDALITKCLQPHPDARFQSAADLVGALDRLDDGGHAVVVRPPRPSAVKLGLVAIGLVAAAIAATWLMIGRRPVAAAPHDPVSLLIADFDNRASDPVFDGSLEDALSVTMEGASFITAFSRSNARTIYARLRPGAALDEEGARLVAQREGIKVVLAGAIDLDGRRYRLTVRAVEPGDGTLVTTAAATAGTKAEVLGAVTSVAARLRQALGDTTARSGRIAATETFTAASLEAAQAYSRGQELFYAAKREEAIASYQEALIYDPDMGRAYAGWALAAALLGRTEEAEAKYKEAFARLDRMTEREKLITLGHYYLRVARNPEKAIETFSQLVAKYPADASALNNLAVAQFRALHFADALEYGKRLVSVYPEQVQWRYNYALYAMYAGDFDTAHTHGEEALKRNPDTPKAYLAIAMAALARRGVADAREVWARAAASSAQGASLAATGVADLALYEGRAQDAAATLAPAIESDRTTRNTAGAAAKLIAHAEAEQMRGNGRQAVSLAQEAIKASRAESVVVPAARLLLAAGRRADALSIASELGQRLSPQARAYGKAIWGEAAIQEGRTVDGIEMLREGVRLADLWLLRYSLGIGYVQAGAFAEALSELEACEKRRGEAASVFLNDDPTWRYRAPLTYWLARARQGVGLTSQAMEGYNAFLALRPSSPRDPLVVDARRRVIGS